MCSDLAKWPGGAALRFFAAPFMFPLLLDLARDKTLGVTADASTMIKKNLFCGCFVHLCLCMCVCVCHCVCPSVCASCASVSCDTVINMLLSIGTHDTSKMHLPTVNMATYQDAVVCSHCLCVYIPIYLYMFLNLISETTHQAPRAPCGGI